MAGHVIGTYLMEKKHQVIGVARQKSSVCKTKVCDISDKGKVKEIILQRGGARFLADDRQPDYDRISGAVKCNHLTQSNRAAIQMYIQYEWDTGKQEGIRYPCPGNGFPLFFMPHNNRRP